MSFQLDIFFVGLPLRQTWQLPVCQCPVDYPHQTDTITDNRKWKMEHLCYCQALRRLPSLVSLGLGRTLRQRLVSRKTQRLWASKRRPNWNSVSHHSFPVSFLLLEGSKSLHPWKGHSSLLQADKVLSLPSAWMSPTHPSLVLTCSCRTAKSRSWQLLMGISHPALRQAALCRQRYCLTPHPLWQVGTNPEWDLGLN